MIDETEEDLNRLMNKDFGTDRKQNFHDRLLAWLHYRARCVPAVLRSVHGSEEVIGKQIQFPAIGQIRLALMTGGDVGPWLSNRTRIRKADHLADMMFNDWQIVHFHLGGLFQSTTTIHRTKSLLFAHITAETATLLDVQPHGSWTQTALLEILLRTNPPALERYEIRGVTLARPADKQRENLRAHRMNSAVEIGGRAFMPSLGITASGHAARINRYADWFHVMAQKIRCDLEGNRIESRFKTVILGRLGVPIRLGAYYDHSGLAIIDKNRNGLVLHQMKPLE